VVLWKFNRSIEVVSFKPNGFLYNSVISEIRGPLRLAPLRTLRSEELLPKLVDFFPLHGNLTPHFVTAIGLFHDLVNSYDF